MYKFKSSLFGLLGVLTLVALVTVALPNRGAGGTGGSAPTSQTQNVNVVNTPTISAQQSGPWNVGINGTLPVRDVDNPAKEPFQASASLVLPFGQTFGFQNIIVVPVGKVLVIEDISVDARLTGVDKLISVALFTGGANYYLHPNDEGTDEFGRRVYTTSQHVRLYFTQGNVVGGYATRNPATGQPDVNFSIFGYFVDAQ
jgi:hypothetical protein